MSNMNALIGVICGYALNPEFTAALLDAALKSFVILGLATGLCVSWRRASAATRHLIWFLATASLLWLPVVALVKPSSPKPLWSVGTSFNSGNQFALTLELVPDAIAPRAHDQTPTSLNRGEAFGANEAGAALRVGAQFHAAWFALGLVIWAGGALLVLCSLAASQVRCIGLSRRAKPVGDPEWVQLLGNLCEALGIRRSVILLQSAENIMPLTWGWLRPVILLPAEAAQWPRLRRRLVVEHELAHVKRWDCLTQAITRVVCAFYWFNPLVWLAERQMRAEREYACDDLMVTNGWKPSEYATQLIEIADTLRPVAQTAGIAMARRDRLSKRVAAIVDASRARRCRVLPTLGAVSLMLALTIWLGEWKLNAAQNSGRERDPLWQKQLDWLKKFSVAKEKQSRALAAKAGEEILPEYRRFFDAATNGNWQAVTNLYENLKKRHPHYIADDGDTNLWTSYWHPVLETCLAYIYLANGEPRYNQLMVDEILNSIPPGSIYFGGTDPGRGLITAFSQSHADGDPFFTLTQNALADMTYRDYLEAMYGGKIYLPSPEDVNGCFVEYLEDAQCRLKENKLKPGEDVRMIEEEGQRRIQISGQVAVMEINGLIAKLIFDKNPDHEFYVEESFPLDWMYPHLLPHGLIMKLNRNPLPKLPEDVVEKDREYWTKLVKGMIGDWLTYETPLSDLIAFAEKVYLKGDFAGFKGDQRYVKNEYAHKTFSKLRSAIAGLYAWRAANAADASERARMNGESDFAFRQAFAMCPYSPEAVFRYTQLLVSQHRVEDALRVARTCQKFEINRDKDEIINLVQNLEKLGQSQSTNSSPTREPNVKQVGR